MARRRVLAALVSIASALLLAGCGVADDVVGLHPIPTEQAGGAPLTEQMATVIVTRVLSRAEAAGAATGTAGTQARQKALSGSALSIADAAARTNTPVAAPDPLATPSVPMVLAIVKGRAWPRTIVATTLDQVTSTRSLHVLTSAAPTAPFVLAASVPMLSGTSVPAIGPVAGGVQPVTGGAGLVAAPAAILREYAGALAYPTPGPSPHVELNDALSSGLRSTALAQTATFKSLASVTQSQQVVGTPSAFGLADGGALVFGELVRTDTITVAPGATSVTLPAAVAALFGRSIITRSVRVTSVETVVLVVPTSGKATVIGAAEQIASAKGS